MDNSWVSCFLDHGVYAAAAEVKAVVVRSFKNVLEFRCKHFR